MLKQLSDFFKPSHFHCVVFDFLSFSGMFLFYTLAYKISYCMYLSTQYHAFQLFSDKHLTTLEALRAIYYNSIVDHYGISKIIITIIITIISIHACVYIIQIVLQNYPWHSYYIQYTLQHLCIYITQQRVTPHRYSYKFVLQFHTVMYHL